MVKRIQIIALVGVLVSAVSVTAFDAVAVILKVDAEQNILHIRAGGKDRVVPFAVDAKILSGEGAPLIQGLKAPELKPGAEVTVTVDQVDGRDVITAIRLGVRASVGFKPLIEMTASESYKGEDGGLYGGGRNVPPASHVAAARAATAKIIPLNVDGKPAVNGTIALVSISMSNATQEFSLFKQLADADAQKSPRVTIVDCAQGGQAMAQWVAPDGRAWTEADRRLDAAKVGRKQVQVAWIKLANVQPKGELSDHGRKLYDDTLAVLHNAKQRFPNLHIAYLGSRIYGGYAATPLNPEPYAYEGAFVVRWLIQDQIRGDGGLRHNTGGGEARAPLLLWGPYFWADGTTPRKSDGLIWQRQDLANDGIHPSESGRRKVADMLLAFFKTDSLAATWFGKP